MFPILETSYHDYTELNNRHKDENIKTEYSIYRDSMNQSYGLFYYE